MAVEGFRSPLKQVNRRRSSFSGLKSPPVRVATPSRRQTIAEDADAEASYREAIRLDPKQAGFHWNYSHLLYEQGDLTGAIREMRECVQLGRGAREQDARAKHHGEEDRRMVHGDLREGGSRREGHGLKVGLRRRGHRPRMPVCAW